jgi:6-phosphogluconolactonase
MSDLRATALSPFVPSGKDYEKSRQLFLELGFEISWSSDDLTGFRNGPAQFTLQKFDDKHFAENLMMSLFVLDLDAWYNAVAAKHLDKKYPGFRMNAPTQESWGREVNFIDIAGVCWHVQPAKEVTKTESKQKTGPVVPVVRTEVFDNNDKIGRAAVDLIAEHSSIAIKQRGKFTVAFSGGSLPEIIAKGLAQEDIKSKIDFSKWVVCFADERCVALDHADSNYKACNQFIFSKVGLASHQIHSIAANLVKEPEKAALDYEELIKKVVPLNESKIPEFDLLLLGMGPDGHCCSLFPGHKLLKEEKKLVAHITDSPKPPDNRITLTYPVINAAKAALFVVTGSAKKDVLKQILETNNSYCVLRCSGYPSALVKPASVTWMLDKAAAGSFSM